MPSNDPIAASIARLVDTLAWLIPLSIGAVLVLVVLMMLLTARSPRRH